MFKPFLTQRRKERRETPVSFPLTAVRFAELLKNTEEKSIHFARNIGTRLTPYWFFIKGSVGYRIDTQLKDRRELNVSIEGNTVLLTPKNGTPIGKELSLETTRRLLSGFPNSAYFCNVMVHPDSMEAFVQFRRNLRSLGYKVNWNARTRFALVFASNPEYSSSD